MLKSLMSDAVTSSWVLKGFEAQTTTSAPPSRRVIARLAVSVVTCRQAETFKPSSGRSVMKRLRMSLRTGIHCAAHSMRAFPLGARPRSLASPPIFLAFVVAI